MQRLEVSCAVRPIYGSLGAKGLSITLETTHFLHDIPQKEMQARETK
jgi:hypothetical protein